jgi:hypothetical protein
MRRSMLNARRGASFSPASPTLLRTAVTLRAFKLIQSPRSPLARGKRMTQGNKQRFDRSQLTGGVALDKTGYRVRYRPARRALR